MLNQFQVQTAAADAAIYKDADSIVLLLCKECVAGLGKLALPAAVEKAVAAYTAAHTDIFGVGTLTHFVLPTEEKLLNIIIVGCGEGSDCKANNFRKAAGEAARALHKAKAEQAVLAAPIVLNPERSANVECIAEGLYLGGYVYNKFKSDAKPVPLCTATLLTAVGDAAALVQAAEVRAEAVCYARDLVNDPGNVVTPFVLADEALQMAHDLPLDVDILDEALLQANGMNAILAVGQGSKNPPCMITLKYQGAGDAPFTAFVGKGITFDSGGISIKPDDNMGEMKDDMTGAAAVLGAIRAIASLGLPCNVMAILACAENMPSSKAQRPGDIVRAANGKTIEVVSTDAEGRMVLADGVWYACHLGAKQVIDIATLTGAVIIALGEETSGIVANDAALVEQLQKAGRMAGENYWQLPSLPECKEAIKSDVADLLNSAGRAGGCITGGLFIGEFVDENIPWAHLDIGGTSTAKKTAGFKVKGGTAFGTMTLIKLAGML